MNECTSCDAELDFRETFCPKCGQVTERGMGAGQLAGRYVTELGTGLGKLVSAAIAYAANPQNRTKVIAGASVLALLLITFTSNPITRGIGSLFEETPEMPQLTADGLPDLASYEDVFVGEETEFFVTGPANVRDFPTSEGTTVIRTLNEGATVKAREVKAFDPTSRWLKLAGGGYVWGANLVDLDQIENDARTGEGLTAVAEFAQVIRGRWSSMDSCRGAGPDAIVEISANEIRISESLGRLERVSKDERGNDIYHVAFSSLREEWPETLSIFLTANGFSLIMSNVLDPNQPDGVFHVPDAGCRPEFMID